MTNCDKINTCEKIMMVLDKDMAGDWQYAECMRAVCALCTDKVVSNA